MLKGTRTSHVTHLVVIEYRLSALVARHVAHVDIIVVQDPAREWEPHARVVTLAD